MFDFALLRSAWALSGTSAMFNFALSHSTEKAPTHALVNQTYYMMSVSLGLVGCLWTAQMRTPAASWLKTTRMGRIRNMTKEW